MRKKFSIENMHSAVFELLVSGAYDRKKFTRPMSKNARNLFGSLLKFVAGQPTIGGSQPIVRAIEPLYDPLMYEDYVLKYDMSTYADYVSKLDIKTIDDAMLVLLMERMSDKVWVDQNIKEIINVPCVPSRHKEVYDWFTTFVFSDFNENDIRKICDVALMTNLDFIKACASDIRDYDKHSVSYLYAVVLSEIQKKRAIKMKDNAVSDMLSKKLLSAFEIESEARRSKRTHEFKDKSEEWNMDIEMARLARENK